MSGQQGPHLARHGLHEEVAAVAQHRLVHRLGLERLHVHELVRGAVVVRELHLDLHDGRLLHRLAGTEGLLLRRAVQQVLELGAHESRALAGLDVQELDHLYESVQT